MEAQPLEVIINFLKSIGLSVIQEKIPGPAFLPGLCLKQGSLVIDIDKLQYPGDVLHEAGHLCTMPPDVRGTMDDTLPVNDLNNGGEILAIAWSYAACVYLRIDPHFVFHADGYKSGRASIVQNFAVGYYIGLPLLQWAGMAYDNNKAEEFNTLPYPHMIRWLREN